MRWLKIILILLFIVLIGLFFYFFVTTKPAPTQTETAPTSVTSSDVAISQVAATLFSSSLISFYWTNSKTNAVYFLTPEGKIYKTFGDGRDELVSEQTLPNLHAVTASPDGTKVIASFSYPLNTTLAVFDTNTNSWERLPGSTVAATFDATSGKIAYVQSGPNGGIAILNLLDRKTTNVIQLNALDGVLTWNKPDELLLTGLPSSFSPPEIWSIFIKNKTVKQIADLASPDTIRAGRTSVMYQFSPDGNYGLKLGQPTLNDATLYLTDGGGVTITKLAFTTLPSKCSFSAQTLYCAIPRELPARAVLPDDYLKEKILTDDTFISYGVETGAFTILPQPENPVDAEQLLVRGEQLLFRNRYDGKLYALPLK